MAELSSRFAAVFARTIVFANRKERTETQDSVFSVLPVEWVSAFAKIALLNFRFLWLKGTSPLQNPWSKVVLLTWNSGYLQGHPYPLSRSLMGRQVILRTF